ncbi:MAG: hypothetical protein PWP24_639, partial [Clostridiales bacterium]|nr:hypothetical protein [Clostridiales bacterium]
MKLSNKFQKVLSVMLAVALLIGMSGIPSQLVQADTATTTTAVSPADSVNSGD